MAITVLNGMRVCPWPEWEGWWWFKMDDECPPDIVYACRTIEDGDFELEWYTPNESGVGGVVVYETQRQLQARLRGTNYLFSPVRETSPFAVEELPVGDL